jgi:hypothetical protein
MGPFQRRPGARSDIEKLEQGFNRADVALKALEESQLTPKQVQELKALMKRVSLSATEIKTIGRHQAVVGQISVEGRLLDTVLTEGSYNKSRSEQMQYAHKLGYRMATRAEHLAYVEDLLAKEDNETINDAEEYALQIYRQWNRYVRDYLGGLGVDDRRVCVVDIDWYSPCDVSDYYALFVRASKESK